MDQYAQPDDDQDRRARSQRGKPDTALIGTEVIALTTISSPSSSTPLNATVNAYGSPITDHRTPGAPAGAGEA